MLRSFKEEEFIKKEFVKKEEEKKDDLFLNPKRNDVKLNIRARFT